MNQIKIGKYITEKRQRKGLTQKDIAEKLLVSDKAVSKWERGICLPNIDPQNFFWAMSGYEPRQ